MAERLLALLLADAELKALLEALRRLALPQWRLVSGCLYQTVWNADGGRPPRHGLKDLDLVYFDAERPDAVSEAAAAAAARRAAGPLGALLQTRNQARVHLWYERRFGSPYPALPSADAALLRYPAKTQALGVRLEADGSLSLQAPFGLEDVYGMVWRPNPAWPNRATFEAKAARLQALWPDLRVLPWPD